MPHQWFPSEKYTFSSSDLLIQIPGTNLHILAPFLAVPVYLFLCLFFLPLLVPRRYEVRGLLALHNGFLLLLSLIMFGGTVSACYKALKGGATLFDLFCDADNKWNRGELYYWVWIFHLTKYYELLDTVFIVIKKEPASFIQWFHHAITLLVTWHGLESGTTYQWMAVVTNSFVHIIMYYYFMLTAILPRGSRIWWKPWVTRVQLIQFFINLGGVSSWAWASLTSPKGCSGNWNSWAFVLFVNLAFFFLFSGFYQKTYVGPRRATVIDDDKTKSE